MYELFYFCCELLHQYENCDLSKIKTFIVSLKIFIDFLVNIFNQSFPMIILQFKLVILQFKFSPT